MTNRKPPHTTEILNLVLNLALCSSTILKYREQTAISGSNARLSIPGRLDLYVPWDAWLVHAQARCRSKLTQRGCRAAAWRGWRWQMASAARGWKWQMASAAFQVMHTKPYWCTWSEVVRRYLSHPRPIERLSIDLRQEVDHCCRPSTMLLRPPCCLMRKKS